VVHPQSSDGAIGRRPIGGLGDPAKEIVAGRDAWIADVDGAKVLTGRQEVVVGVDETRKHGAAGAVDDLGLGAHPGPNGLARANGEDDFPADRQRLRAGGPRLGREDGAALEEQRSIGRRHRPRRYGAGERCSSTASHLPSAPRRKTIVSRSRCSVSVSGT
jgi:hypothetical protein